MQRFLLTILLFIGLCPAVFSREIRAFTNINESYNLDGAVASGICQDSYGRIWFSTRVGFTVFDGSEYRRLAGNGNYYRNILCDRFNRIWALDISGTVARTDREGKRIETVSACPGGVKDIFQTSFGDLYIVDSSNSIFKLEPDSDGEVSTLVPYLIPQDMAAVHGILGDDLGTVWTMCDAGLYRDTVLVTRTPTFCGTMTREGIAFGAAEGQILAWDGNTLRSRFSGTLANIVSILGDPDGRGYLFATDRKQLFHTQRNERCRQIAFNSLVSGPLHIHHSPGGPIWVYSEDGGLAEYDPQKRSTLEFFDSSRQSGWNSGINIKSLFTDSQGHLWMGISDGCIEKLTIYDSPFNIMPLSVEAELGNSPRAFVKASDGSMILGTMDGWGYVLDSDMQRTFTRRFSQQIYCMTFTHDGSFWVGTNGDGLFEFRSTGGNLPSLTRSVYQYRRDPDEFYGINCNHIYNLRENPQDHRLWIASSDGGLSYVELDTDKREFINKNNRLVFPTEVTNVLRDVTIAPNGWLFAGGVLGLFVSHNPCDDPEDIQFQLIESLANNDVHSVFFTSDGQMYACVSGKGLLCFGTAYGSSSYKAINKESGLVSDFVLSAVEDKNGDIWVASEAGLNRYRPSDGTIRSFIFADKGDHVTLNEGLGLCDETGTVYLTTSHGLLYFDPSDVRESGFTPQILSSLSLGGAPVDVSGDGYINARTSDVVRLDFVAVDMRSPERIRYRYRMSGKGFDNEWKDIGGTRTMQLSLNQPGKYTLQLQSTNSEGALCDNTKVFRFKVGYPARRVITRSLLLSFILLALVLVAWQLIRRERRKSPGTPRDEYSLSEEDRQFVDRLNAYLGEHLDDSTADVNQMVAHMNMGRSSFYDKVRELYGKTPTGLLKDLRFEKAEELMKSGGYTVSQIAYMTGFDDARYFSTLFKSRYGMTPSQYRKKHSVNS